MPDFEVGADGLWRHKGWLAVRPGDLPVDPTTSILRRLQILEMSAAAAGSTSGSGGGGTYFGTEPYPNGNGLANQQVAINKMGGRPSIRQFLSSNWTTNPVHLAGVSVVQTSWSPRDSEVIAGTLDSNIAGFAGAALNGDILTYAHESDNDSLTAAQKTARLNAMNHFYDVVKATKPGVLVAPTVTGYMFSPNNPSAAAAQAPWVGMKGDLLGLDLDGVHADGKTTYSGIDYNRHMTNAKVFMQTNKAKGWVGFCVPEHMTSRITSFDPDGSLRAAWFDTNMAYIATQGAYACMCFDSVRPVSLGGESSTAFNVLPNPSPELTVWKKYVATNPANPA